MNKLTIPRANEYHQVIRKKYNMLNNPGISKFRKTKYLGLFFLITMCRAREFGTHSSKWDVSIKFPLKKERQKKILGVRGDGWHQENKPF